MEISASRLEIQEDGATLLVLFFRATMTTLSDHKRPRFFEEILAEREEIKKHKWLLSEEAGRDVGIDLAHSSWVVHHRKHWLQKRRKQRHEES